MEIKDKPVATTIPKITAGGRASSTRLQNDLIAIATNDHKSISRYSMEDSVLDRMTTIDALAQDSKPIMDAYRNDLTSIGTADVAQSFNSYGFNNDTLNWPLWLSLYNDSWVFRRAIDKPSQDMVNAGFTITGDGDYSKIYKEFNKHKFELTKQLQWGALFGGSVAVMLFDTVSDDEMKDPMKKSKIKGSVMKLYVTDRWYGVGADTTRTVADLKNIDFGKPEYYEITFANGKTFTVHHSYILRYEHRTAPNLIKNGQLQGWGYAEGAHILNELSRDDQLKGAITSLVNKALIEVIKMSGMRGVFMGTDEANEEQLRKRLEMVNWGRNYNSLTFLDKEDEYEKTEFGGLEGLSNLLETNMWLIAAALEMQGILFGDMKGGLNQESDAMSRYAITIENRCNSYFRPILQKILTIFFIMHELEPNVNFEFNRLTKKEDNLAKVNSVKALAELLNSLTSDGVISRYQTAITLKDFLDKDILSINFSKENLNKLKLEEEYDILKTLKASGKTESYSEQARSDFPSIGRQETMFGGTEGGDFGGAIEGEGGGEEMAPAEDLGGETNEA